MLTLQVYDQPNPTLEQNFVDSLLAKHQSPAPTKITNDGCFGMALNGKLIQNLLYICFVQKISLNHRTKATQNDPVLNNHAQV